MNLPECPIEEVARGLVPRLCVRQHDVAHFVIALKHANRASEEGLGFRPARRVFWGYEQGLKVTVDNSYVLQKWHGGVPRPRCIRARGFGQRGAATTTTCARPERSPESLGVPLTELPELAKLAKSAGAKVVGLHRHNGSGVFDVNNWEQTATLLASLTEQFPDVRVIDIGGGLGVPERADQPGLDLAKLDTALAAVKEGFPLKLELWYGTRALLRGAPRACWSRASRSSSPKARPAMWAWPPE